MSNKKNLRFKKKIQPYLLDCSILLDPFVTTSPILLQKFKKAIKKYLWLTNFRIRYTKGFYLLSFNFGSPNEAYRLFFSWTFLYQFLFFWGFSPISFIWMKKIVLNPKNLLKFVQYFKKINILKNFYQLQIFLFFEFQKLILYKFLRFFSLFIKLNFIKFFICKNLKNA
jgi:hypothetical protein